MRGHQPLTDRELRDLVARCDSAQGAKQLALSYASLRSAYEDVEANAKINTARELARLDTKIAELRLLLKEACDGWDDATLSKLSMERIKALREAGGIS